MSWSENINSIDRVQRALIFKIIASVLIVLLGLGGVIAYAVAQAARADQTVQLGVVEPSRTDAEKTAEAELRRKTDPTELKAQDDAVARMKSEMETVANIANRLRDQSLSTGRVTLGITVGVALALAAVWIGLGLTYLGVLLLGAVIVAPLLLIGARGGGDAARTAGGVGAFVAGVLILALAFSTLVRAAALALGYPHPITAIARNVIHEAVRMKISLVFIVILIIALAALPGVLTEGGPLRYKVQNFLQYGLSGSFLLAAVLVLFLSAATLTFEQRDKVIWQTMTKPVRAWQYVLGKWLGVSIVGALLLAVSGTGVYLFTEYLRHQRAQGEVEAFKADPKDATRWAEDRFVLEFQVLSGRETVNPLIPEADSSAIDSEINRRVSELEKLHSADPKNPAPDPARIVKDVMGERLRDFLSIAPDQNEGRTYTFDRLQSAKAIGMPMALRYKINAGNNAPSDQYRITFQVGQSQPRVVTTPLAQMMTLPIYPEDITTEGVLEVAVFNGDVYTNARNPATILFSAGDGLQVSYPVSTFAPNFLRALLVLWLKLVFLSAIAICAATFLSFAVACLVAFGVFLMAESAGFLAKAVENYAVTDEQQNTIWYKWIVGEISNTVASAFAAYGNLSPTTAVVEGKYLPWSSVATAAVLLLGMGLLFFAVGSAIFQKRELAIYSGQ
ncbi:hypothetical protein BH11PLA1_BH11PLA1_07750 [soil metagenome]